MSYPHIEECRNRPLEGSYNLWQAESLAWFLEVERDGSWSDPKQVQLGKLPDTIGYKATDLLLRQMDDPANLVTLYGGENEDIAPCMGYSVEFSDVRKAEL